MKYLHRPWLREFLAPRPQALLTREEFVARHFPKYVTPYRLDYRIRLRADGRPTRATSGTAKAQNAKRDTIIDTAFRAYLSDFNASFNHYTP